MAGKLLTGKNMADLGQNRHSFPAIIIPSKGYKNNCNKVLIIIGRGKVFQLKLKGMKYNKRNM